MANIESEDINVRDIMFKITLLMIEALGGPGELGLTVVETMPEPVAASTAGTAASALKLKVAKMLGPQVENGVRGVKYVLAPTPNPKTIKALNGNNKTVYTVLRAAGKDGARAAEVAEASDMKIKSVESALHALRTMQVAKSVPLA